MTERLTDMIERLTARKVLPYQSQVMFDPDVVVEMFVFDSAANRDERAATAEGQTQDDTIGEATDQDALDSPTASGQ